MSKDTIHLFNNLSVKGIVANGSIGAGNTTVTGFANVTSTLQVGGVATFANQVSVPLGSASAPSYTFTGDLNTGMWSPAADTIAFSEGGVEAMRIDSTGNVGIGNTAPASKLHVAGDTRLAGSTTLAAPNTSAAAWTTGGIALVQSAATFTDTTSSGTVSDVRMNNFAAQTLAASSATTVTNLYGTYFTVPVAGANVTASNIYAIGADTLRVAGTTLMAVGTTTGQFVVGSTAMTGTITFGQSTASQTTNIQAGATASGNTKTINIGTNGLSGSTTAITIGTNSGGTSSTTFNGSVTFAGAVSGITTLAAGNTTITGFANVSTSVNSALLTVGTSFIANTTGAYHTGTVNAASYTIGSILIANTTQLTYTSNVNFDSGVLFVDSSNNRVGIGTTTPAVALEVSSATVANTLTTPTEIRISTTTNASDWLTTSPWGRLSFYSADTSDSGPKIQGAIDAIADGATGARMSMVFSTTVPGANTLTERMRITSNGNVGIGNTAPASTLVVAGTVTLGNTTIANTIAVPLGSAAAPSYTFTGDLNTGIFSPGADTIAFSEGGTEAMRINSSGIVGIGRTTGFEGSLTLADYINLARNTDGWLFKHQRTDDSRQMGLYAEGHSTPNLAVYTNGSERMRVMSGGNVGIGNTAPANKLFVTGDIGLDGISVRDTATTTTTATTQITLIEYPIATYNTGEFVIQAVSAGAIHTTKVLVVSNTTVVNATAFASVLTGSSLFTVNTDISSANTRIRITPASATSTTFKASYQLITA